MAVNKERIELLCQALESGEFKQARETMRGEDEEGNWGYCCLGVATMVALRSGDVSEDEVWRYPPRREDVDEYGVLSPAVAAWYGFRTYEKHEAYEKQQHDPLLATPAPDEYNPGLATGKDSNKLNTTASALNDDYNYSFERIAAAFRRTYLEEQP